MRLRVRLTYSGEWAQLIPEIAKQCNMSVDEFCRRAVMLTVKTGVENGRQQPDQSSTGDTPGNGLESGARTTTTSGSLPNPETAAVVERRTE